jgi:hypothetical protein
VTRTFHKGHPFPLPNDTAIGPGTASVVLPRHRSSSLQSKVIANLDSEFTHQSRFAPGWNFGEAQLREMPR